MFLNLPGDIDGIWLGCSDDGDLEGISEENPHAIGQYSATSMVSLLQFWLPSGMVWQLQSA